METPPANVNRQMNFNLNPSSNINSRNDSHSIQYEEEFFKHDLMQKLN